MAELQVFAGAGGVVLRAQRVLHLLDLQLEGVERAKDFLHAVVVVLVVGVRAGVVRHLAGIDVPASSALHGIHHGERVDDIAGGALLWGDYRDKRASRGDEEGDHVKVGDEMVARAFHLQGAPGVRWYRSLPSVQFDPVEDKLTMMLELELQMIS